MSNADYTGGIGITYDVNTPFDEIFEDQKKHPPLEKKKINCFTDQEFREALGEVLNRIIGPYSGKCAAYEHQDKPFPSEAVWGHRDSESKITVSRGYYKAQFPLS